MTASQHVAPYAIQCEGKAVFDSWSRAQRRIRLWRLGGRRYQDDVVPSPYRCPHCGRYHIGNMPKGWRHRPSSPPTIEVED